MDLTTWQVAVLIIAPVFATVFDQLVNWMKRNKVEGETALFVMVGVAVTGFLSVPFIGWENLGWVAIMFCLTGAPMAIGYRIRHHKDQARAREELEKAGRVDYAEKD